MRKLLLILSFIFSVTANAQYMDYYEDAGRLIGPNTTIHLATHHLKTMMREASSAPLLDVTADGQAVGLIYDQSVNGLIIKATADTFKPFLGSDGTRTAYLDFDGTNDRMEIFGTTSFFNKLWDVVPFGTICMWVKFDAAQDGVSTSLFTSTDLTTDPGFQIQRFSSNKMSLRAGDGDPSTGGADLSWTYTSTADINSADGWVGIIVSINGTGASAGRAIFMDSGGIIFEDATFAVGAGSTVNSQGDLYSPDFEGDAIIGARFDPAGTYDLFFDGQISTIICENFPVHDALIEEFRNYNPARNTTSEFPPIIQYRYDINNGAYVFEDAAGTDLAEDNDPVRVVRNSVIGNYNIGTVGSALRRNCSSSSSGTSPTYQTNEINGRAVLDYDGTDDNLTFLRTFFAEAGGKNTLFIVAKNDDASLGSHIFRGSNYIVLTGSSYSVPLPTNPRWVVHHAVVGSDINIASENDGVDDYKIFAYTRNGSSLAAWNGDKTKNTDTSSDIFTITDMGLAHSGPGATWNFDGKLAYMAKYNGVMTDAEIEAEIDRLKSEYGLFIIPFFGGLLFLRRRKSNGLQLMEETFKQAA